MHTCKDVFRRRNLLLHKTNKAIEVDKADEVNEINKQSK